MGGVIIILTRGMGKPMYGLSLLSHSVMGCLGGLLFNGRCSCTEDSSTGNLGLYCGDSLTVFTCDVVDGVCFS